MMGKHAINCTRQLPVALNSSDSFFNGWQKNLSDLNIVDLVRSKSILVPIASWHDILESLHCGNVTLLCVLAIFLEDQPELIGVVT